MYVINICELVITFSSTKKSESKKSLIHFFTFALFYKWEKKNHLEMLLKAVSKFGKKNIEKKTINFYQKVDLVFSLSKV